MRKIYILPNLVTTANMFCGFYSVIASIQYEFGLAAWMIVLAGVFDVLDGRVARLARATSSFGVEYDSLSDLVSFGIAPGILIYLWGLQSFDRLGWLAAFLFLACGAFRLARFNVNSDRIPKKFFQGLPIPTAAGLIATFIIFGRATQFPSDEMVLEWTSLILCLGTALLMVSSLPFPSFKEVNWRSRASFGYLFLAVVALVLVIWKPEVTLFVILMIYLVSSLAGMIFRRKTLKIKLN